MSRRLVALLLIMLFAMVQGSACPVCFSAKEGTREAFVWTTVLLSLVPLTMIGGGVYTIFRFTRQKAE